MSKIFVNYIVQNDQWESINEPNLYVLPGTYSNLNLITAGLIYDTFPIKHQRFYLRFFLETISFLFYLIYCKTLSVLDC